MEQGPLNTNKNTNAGQLFLQQIGAPRNIKQYTQGMVQYQKAAPDVLNVGNLEVGQSKYDRDISSLDQMSDINEFRAEDQPWYSKVGGSLLKGGITAATTFLDNTLGMLSAAATAPVNGVSAFAGNNPFSEAMIGLQNWSKDAIPYYETNEQKQNEASGQWYKNLLSPTYVVNQLTDQLGFTLGAVGAGAVFGAGLGEAFKGAGVVKNLLTGAADIEKNGTLLSDIITGVKDIKSADVAVTAAKNAKALTSQGLFRNLAGAMFGAQGEARFEGINNSSDWANLEYQRLDDDLAKRKQQLVDTLPSSAFETVRDPNTGELTRKLTEGASEQVNHILDLRRNAASAEIESDKWKMANRDFAGNMILLTLSNSIEFGRFLGGGYKAAAKTTSKLLKPVYDDAGKLLKVAVEPRAAAAIAKGTLKNLMSEGNEEMLQQSLATGAGYQQSANLNSFYGASLDPDGQKNVQNGWRAFAKGLEDTYTDPKQWEQFFYGGLMGAVGTPMLSRSEETGKLGLSWEGGFNEAAKENKADVKQAEQSATEINNLMADPKFQPMIDHLVRSAVYNKQKKDAVERGDIFDYENAKNSDITSAAVAFDRAGRIDDLYNIINSAANVNDKDVQTIRDNYVDPETKKPIYTTDTTNDEIKKDIQDRAKSVKDQVDKVRKFASDLATQLGPDVKPEVLDEATFLQSHIDDMEGRFKNILDKTRTDLQPFIDYLKKINYTYKGPNGIDIDPTTIYTENPSVTLITLGKAYNDLIHNTPNEEGAKTAKSLIALEDTIKDNEDSIPNSKEVLQSLNDLEHLIVERAGYINRFKDITTNPLAYSKTLDDIKKDTDKQAQDKVDNDIKDTLRKSTDLNDYRNKLSKITNTEDRNRVRDELAKEGHEFSQTDKEMSQVQGSLMNHIDTNTNKEDSGDVASSELAKNMISRVRKNSTSADQMTNLTHPDYNQNVEYNEANEPINEDITREAKNKIAAAVNKVTEQAKTPYKKDIKTNRTGEEPTTTKEQKAQESEDLDIAGRKFSTLKDEKEEKEANIKKMEALANVGIAEWSPSVPEYDKTDMANKDYSQDFGERHEHMKPFHSNLKANGAFSYVNDGNVKSGDKVNYLVRKEDVEKFQGNKGQYFPIYISVKDKDGKNQIIGNLPDGNIASEIKGMKELRDRVRKEYEDAPEEDKKEFISKETTQVARVHSGRITFINKDQDLKDVEGATTKVDGKTVSSPKLIFALVKGNRLQVPHKSSLIENSIKEPPTLRNGALYVLVKGADNKYYPVLVHTKNFNINLDDSTVPTVTDAIKKVATRFATAALTGGQNELIAAKDELRKYVYFQDNSFFIDKVTDKQTGDISLRFRLLGEDDKAPVETVIPIAKKSGSLLGEAIGLTSKPITSIEELSNNIYNNLKDFGFHFQVDASLLNTASGNDKLINDNILTSDIKSLDPISSFPILRGMDEKGNLLPITEHYVKVKPSKKKKATSNPSTTTVSSTGTVETNYTKVIDPILKDEYYINSDINEIYIKRDENYIKADIKDNSLSTFIQDKAIVSNNGGINQTLHLNNKDGKSFTIPIVKIKSSTGTRFLILDNSIMREFRGITNEEAYKNPFYNYITPKDLEASKISEQKIQETTTTKPYTGDNVFNPQYASKSIHTIANYNNMKNTKDGYIFNPSDKSIVKVPLIKFADSEFYYTIVPTLLIKGTKNQYKLSYKKEENVTQDQFAIVDKDGRLMDIVPQGNNPQEMLVNIREHLKNATPEEIINDKATITPLPSLTITKPSIVEKKEAMTTSDIEDKKADKQHAVDLITEVDPMGRKINSGISKENATKKTTKVNTLVEDLKKVQENYEKTLKVSNFENLPASVQKGLKEAGYDDLDEWNEVLDDDEKIDALNCTFNLSIEKSPF